MSAETDYSSQVTYTWTSYQGRPFNLFSTNAIPTQADIIYSPWDAMMPPAQNPVAIEYPNGQQNAFAIASNGNLIHAWYPTSNGWSSENLGGIVTGTPSITVFNGQLKIAVDGSDGQTVYTDTYNNGWSGWQKLACCGAGVASIVYNGSYQIYARDTGTGHLIHAWCVTCDGSDWNFEDLGGIITGTPSVIVYNGQVKVIADGNDYATIWQDTYNNGWSGWQAIAGPASAPFGAVMGRQFHIVAHATDTGHAVHAWCVTCNGSDWGFEDFGNYPR